MLIRAFQVQIGRTVEFVEQVRRTEMHATRVEPDIHRVSDFLVLVGLVAEQLGLPIETINLVQGDSDQLLAGGGTGGSRSIMASGKALVEASAEVIEQGRALAAHHLETAIEDLDGTFSFLVSTPNEIGYAKDNLAAKPMVLYETDDMIAIASEEVSLNRLFPGQSINSTEPAPGTHQTWSRSI